MACWACCWTCCTCGSGPGLYLRWQAALQPVGELIRTREVAVLRPEVADDLERCRVLLHDLRERVGSLLALRAVRRPDIGLHVVGADVRVEDDPAGPGCSGLPARPAPARR